MPVENITYMCTKVSIENEGPAGPMCYTELQNGREIEVCVCESSANDMPCNSANYLMMTTTMSIFILCMPWIAAAVAACWHL